VPAEPEPSSRDGATRAVTWGLVLFQFVFGLLWFGVASVLTGEPAIVLTRGAGGGVDLDYSLHLYGVIPARRTHLDDVSSDLQQSTSLAQSSRRPGDQRGPESTQALTVQTHRWITFTDRDGVFEERLPGVFDTSAMAGFFAGGEREYRETYEAGPWRLYGFGALGFVGALVFVGGLWNLIRLALWKLGLANEPRAPTAGPTEDRSG
jgi:hypothetical protein